MCGCALVLRRREEASQTTRRLIQKEGLFKKKADSMRVYFARLLVVSLPSIPCAAKEKRWYPMRSLYPKKKRKEGTQRAYFSFQTKDNTSFPLRDTLFIF